MRKKRKALILILIIVLLLLTNLAFLNKDEKSVKLQATQKEYNTELEENEYMHIEEDINGEKVPVPNGYVGSKADGENGIYTGYVIYEGEEEVTNTNVEEAQKTRNQYVWVPVPDVSKIYGTDKNGKKFGKMYSLTTNTGDDIDEITGAKPEGWSENNGILNVSNYYLEPAIIYQQDTNSKIKTLNLDIKSEHEFLMQIEKEFNQMIESVEKYGGFYVGRYETGNLSKENAVIRKGNTDIGKQTWYAMYRKCKNLNNKNTNVETGMIWGNQWDRTLMWLIESGNKSKEEICKDSTSWGNYSNAEFTYIDSNGNITTKYRAIVLPTGSSEYTKANNIYDLAGNVWDWTMARGDRNRYYRGGSASYSGDRYYSSWYGNMPSVTSAGDIGCRAMLYIK